ncbi:MAG: glycosyltransferase family 9 protein, partial [Deltaproteobacteria bacterium]|nr:glycosyltransferase family 9 protein [Deltaproteobacteria bacterium]
QGFTPVLTGGPADQEVATAVAAYSRVPLVNLAGGTTVGQLAVLLQGAALAITTDTGPMHLAAALGTPVVALFGPTAPWRTGPFGKGHAPLRLDLPCSPCFRRTCPEPRCLTDLPPEAVSAVCEKMLSRPAEA